MNGSSNVLVLGVTGQVGKRVATNLRRREANFSVGSRRQPNYSTIGGDLASAAISNAYYPASNRGVGLLLGKFLIGTGQRAATNLAQEFILRRVTHKATR